MQGEAQSDAVSGADRLRFYRGEIGLQHRLASNRPDALISVRCARYLLVVRGPNRAAVRALS
jgi:hypothetical protein